MSEWLKALPKKIIHYLFIGFLLFFGSFFLYILVTAIANYRKVKQNAKEINANWPKYRCKPYILPFAGWLVGPADTNPLSNFLNCFSVLFYTYFAKFMSPFFLFFKKLLDIIWDMVLSIQHIRQMFAYLRRSIRDFLLDIASLIYGYGKKLSYLYNRMVQTLGLIFNTFYKIFYALAFGIYTVAAMWNSPVGGVARFFCFKKGTPILMKNGTQKPIEEISLGEELVTGKVTATMIFEGKGVDMYTYPVGDTRVTVAGSHLVLEGEKWLRVEESDLAEKTNEMEKLFCLNTTSGKIKIGTVLFADYLEILNPQKIHHIIQKSLNIKKKLFCDREWGLDPTSLVLTKRGLLRLKELRLGDSLLEGGRVEGIVRLRGPQIKYEGVLCSPSMIVWGKQGWQLVTGERCGEGELYHLCTTKGVFRANGLLWRDFEQNKDVKLNKEIDRYVSLVLNRSTFENGQRHP